MSIKLNCAIKSIKHDLSELKIPSLIIIAIALIILCATVFSKYIISLFNIFSPVLILVLVANIIFIYLFAFRPESDSSTKLVNIVLPLAILAFTDFVFSTIISIISFTISEWEHSIPTLVCIFIISIVAMIFLRAYARCKNGEDE